MSETIGTQRTGGMRQLLGRIAIALVVIGATLGVIALLRGELKQEQVKIIFTCWAASYFIACALACQRARPLRALPGTGVCLAGFAVALYGIWARGYNEAAFWKWLWCLTALGLVFAHTSLLSRTREAEHRARFWVSVLAELASWVSVGITLVMVFTERAEPEHWRALGVSSMICLAATVVTSLLAGLSREDTQQS